MVKMKRTDGEAKVVLDFLKYLYRRNETITNELWEAEGTKYQDKIIGKEVMLKEVSEKFLEFIQTHCKDLKAIKAGIKN